jgi:predicted phage terminase large subunit-like protein
MIANEIKQEALRKLAQRNFWTYAQMRIPAVYSDDKKFLKDYCTRLQNFTLNSKKHFMVVGMPPRHFKSLTIQLFAEWMFGRSFSSDMVAYDPTYAIMTGSYNMTLAESFAKGVRNNIKSQEVFMDVFPDVAVSAGDGAAARWKLNDSPVVNYLATAPGGIATGIGAKLIIIDDIIKNPQEAYSQLVKDQHDEWLNSNLMQRLEGKDWKIIFVGTPWSTDDLGQRILQTRDCEHVMYPAYIVKNGKKRFLCPSQLDEKSYNEKIAQMNLDIVEANYLMKPIDIKGRLYHEMTEYNRNELVLKSSDIIKCWIDTSDKGTDYLCAITYVMQSGFCYVLDIIHTDSPMEVTQPLVVDMLTKNKVQMCMVESNNGGRAFMLALRSLMSNKPIYFKDKFSSSQKEGRILASSGWVQTTMRMPSDWKQRYPSFVKDFFNYNSKGKNEHDDAVDCCSLIHMEEAGEWGIYNQPYQTDLQPALHAMNETGYFDNSEMTYW